MLKKRAGGTANVFTFPFMGQAQPDNYGWSGTHQLTADPNAIGDTITSATSTPTSDPTAATEAISTSAV